jgi:glycosyltransferase involved in cell wall biosynthesis
LTTLATLLILGVASTWDRRKGFKYFIELSERIKNDEAVVLIGISEEKKKEIPKNIIGITKTNNVKELVEIYTAADVFVNPTLEDNFPTTNLEALACGTPVLTFDTGGSIESIDESCGIVIAKGNLSKLIEGIRQIKSKDLLTLETKCQIRVHKLYNKMDRFNEYIKLYKSYL